MVEHEQVRPLAPAADRPRSDGEEPALPVKDLRRRRCIRCCGIIAAILVIVAIVVVILIFTVFRVKDPKIKINGITVAHLELINGTSMPKPGVNISLIADLSVKNPNVAAFRYSNTTTTLSYHGVDVGEARGPPGRAKARRTIRMNVTVDLIADRLLAIPNLTSEVGSGLLKMNSYSRIPGRIKILTIRKHITVKMNCSLTFNISSYDFQSQKCKKKVKF